MRRLLTTAILLAQTLLISTPVLALSQPQSSLYNSGVYYFDAQVKSGSSACGGDTNLVGSGNEEKIFNFFLQKGLTPPQAAGAYGNIIRESGGDPENIQNPAGDTKDPTPLTSKTQGWGLIQWTPGSGIIDLAKQAGVSGPIYELSTQLELIWQHMNNHPVVTKPFDLSYYKTITDTATATGYFEDKIEGAGIVAEQDRVNKANEGLQKYGSGSTAPGDGSGDTSCTGSSGEVVGNYSLPVSRKIYNQNPSLFTARHHDYPADDIPVPSGTAVYSMTDGTVLSLTDPNCGNGVKIDAGGGVIFLYCHGEDGNSIVKPGAQVKAGQLIMHSDNTGHSTGPHLHVQIMVNGQNHCPQDLITGIASGNIPDVKNLPTTGCFY